MSEENVDLVKRQIGDIDLAHVLRDDEAWAARLSDIESHFKMDFEFVAVVPGEPIAGRGFDEFRAMFLDWIEPWHTYQPNFERILDLGDRVVVFGRDRGRIKGAEVARVEYYFDRAEGLRAAGLGEPSRAATRVDCRRDA